MFRLSNLPGYLIAKSAGHYDRLVKALLDFWKAQCFLIWSVSMSGYLLAAFNLFALYSARKTSWVLTVLSGIDIVMSAVTKSSVSSFRPSHSGLEHLKKLPHPSHYGKHDPSVYCLCAVSSRGMYGLHVYARISRSLPRSFVSPL